MSPWLTRNYEKSVGQASVPAASGGTGFQPVRRTGKMPVPPRTFHYSKQQAYGT
jgi:hypothetical protein